MAPRKPAKLDQPTLYRARFLGLLGRLVVEWTNVESFLCLLLGHLLRSDPYRADIVFYSHANSLARRELVWRLFVAFVDSAETKDRFEQFLRRFKRATEMRNKYVHAVYQMDDDGFSISTVRFSSNFDGVNHVDVSLSLKDAINELSQACDTCLELNAEIRLIIADAEPHIRGTPQEPPYTHVVHP